MVFYCIACVVGGVERSVRRQDFVTHLALPNRLSQNVPLVCAWCIKTSIQESRNSNYMHGKWVNFKRNRSWNGLRKIDNKCISISSTWYHNKERFERQSIPAQYLDIIRMLMIAYK